MIKELISFFRGKYPPTTSWEEVRQEILDMYNGTKVKFEITPYYYKVTSGNKTWYWKLEDGAFDGTSWDIP